MQGDIFFFLNNLAVSFLESLTTNATWVFSFLFVFLRSLQSEFKCPAYTFRATPRGVSLLE